MKLSEHIAMQEQALEKLTARQEKVSESLSEPAVAQTAADRRRLAINQRSVRRELTRLRLQCDATRRELTRLRALREMETAADRQDQLDFNAALVDYLFAKEGIEHD